MGSEMTDSLGLVGDGDDLDLLADLEACFGFGMTDAEAQSSVTVGDVFTVLQRRFSATNADGGRCLTAMASPR